MIRRLIIGLAMTGACFGAVAGERVTSVPVGVTSMTFESHAEVPASICEKSCRTWITATGPITERTPRDFEDFAAQRDLRGATLVIDSEGGSVVGAIEFGRVVRKLEMNTTVGKSIVARQADGTSASKFTAKASCQSMCVFLLLAGKQRYVAPDSRLLVHQIWLTDKTKGSKTNSYTAEELTLVQRDIGKLVRYTIEMGGDSELLEAALQVPPWEALRRLSGDEIQRMRLSTADDVFTSEHAPVASVRIPAPGISTVNASGKSD
jgi:hypothetical protein